MSQHNPRPDRDNPTTGNKGRAAGVGGTLSGPPLVTGERSNRDSMQHEKPSQLGVLRAMTCDACGNPLSGRQRRWCSATCRQRGHRAKPVRLADSGSASVRFLARFDGYEFEPAEAVALEQAAELAATVERLAGIAEPSVAEL